MPYRCPNCGKSIAPAALNAPSKIIKCVSCEQLFGINDAIPALEQIDLKAAVNKPDRFTVTTNGDNIIISYRWFSWAHIPLLLFCLVWDRFAIFYTSKVFGSLPEGPWVIVMAPFFLCMIGIVLTYYAVAGFFNRTTIRISPGGIIIRNGPMPWPGDKVLLKGELQQLFCRERWTRRGNKCYQLCAVMSDGSWTKVVDAFTSSEDALFIEQQAEKVLNIEDKPVSGEMEQCR